MTQYKPRSLLLQTFPMAAVRAINDLGASHD